MATLDAEYIGELNKGIDGIDEYLLITVSEQMELDDVKEAVAKKYFYDSRYPGSRFCDMSTVMQQPYSEDKFVVILHHRLDI